MCTTLEYILPIVFLYNLRQMRYFIRDYNLFLSSVSSLVSMPYICLFRHTFSAGDSFPISQHLSAITGR